MKQGVEQTYDVFWEFSNLASRDNVTIQEAEEMISRTKAAFFRERTLGETFRTISFLSNGALLGMLSRRNLPLAKYFDEQARLYQGAADDVKLVPQYPDLSKEATSPLSLSKKRPLLTPRQLEVMAVVAEGVTSTQGIADRLIISSSTVKTHLKHVRRILGAPSTTIAVLKLIEAEVIKV